MKLPDLILRIAFLGLMITGFIAATNLNQRQTYVETNGVVERVILDTLPSEVVDTSSAKPSLGEVTVKYLVDEKEYVLQFERTVPPYSYLYGENVTIYYDPTDPNNAVLAPADTEIGFRATMLMVGFSGFGYLLISRNRF